MIEVYFYLLRDKSIDYVFISKILEDGHIIPVEWVGYIIHALIKFLPLEDMPGDSHFSAKLTPRYKENNSHLSYFCGYNVSDVICTKKYL